ncbi:MAG TPA: hypothetical protein VL860_09700 [Planctomycetota bacterium]|nr:hypothetical protein [Planctomycetota bacterium]
MPTLDQAFAALAEPIFAQRDARYQRIATSDQVAALQQEIRAVARDTFGVWLSSQDNTTSPPKVLKSGDVKLDGIVIEKFLYEALPNFWVSAVLYRPAKAPAAGVRRPAMVMPVGHWWGGKNTEMYQRIMRLMARRGVMCAGIDNCGQGERVEHYHPVVRDNMQYLFDIHPAGAPVPFPLADAARHGFVWGNSVTQQHCLIGDPGYLCGVHQNTLTAIAGKRMVDLLIARKDVDPAKIGAMGASGGGTDTRFLLAYDPRIALAVPTSILNSERSTGGGDADQCFFFTLNRGLSSIDLLITLAPKPLLIVSASADEHDSQRVAEYYRPFWKALGKEGNIEYGTGEGPHGFPLGSRKIIAEFILKHFLGDTRPVLDAEHPDSEPVLPESALQATLTGNVGHEGFSKRAMDLIRERAITLQKTRAPLTGEALKAAVREKLLEPADAYTRPAANLKATPAEITWETEGAVPLRIAFSGAATAAPGTPGRVLVCCHDKGPGCPGQSVALQVLAQTGLRVGVLELRGLGVSSPAGTGSQGAMLAPMLMSKQPALMRTAYTIGRSLVGMRVADLLQTARVLKQSLPAGTAIDLVAEGGLGFAATLATFLDPDAYRRVFLVTTPLSWTEFCTNEARAYPFSDFLFGVLEKFDLPDVTRALPPGKLTWINPTDAGAKGVSLAQAKRIHKGAPVEFRLARVAPELLRLFKK